MRALFHVSMPPSPFASCDAVLQEIAAIRTMVTGDIIHLYPARVPGTRFPRRWWGFQQILRLLREDRRVDVHHIFNPDPYPFEVLRLLRKPIVYSPVAGVRTQQRAQSMRLSKRARMIIVPTDADKTLLSNWGITNAEVVQPGIDVSRFTYTPVDMHAAPTLLMGSAPWSEAQFQSKGVHALLELARQRPNLRLIFLWRGVLEDSMRRRITVAGLNDRVKLLTQQVDVNRVLAGVHASVVLVDDEALIKAYPHSLLESLAAGKPVLVSKIIPLAREVSAQGYGVVVGGVDTVSVGMALDDLLANYAQYAAAAQRAMSHVPSQAQMAQACFKVYQAVLRGVA